MDRRRKSQNAVTDTILLPSGKARTANPGGGSGIETVGSTLRSRRPEVDFIAPFVPVFDPRSQPLTVRHDLNELKLCMYEAISDSLNRCPLPPDKLSVALAVAIDEYLGREGEARIERFIREMLRCMEQRTKGITATMMLARDVDVDVAQTRMGDEEVTDWYIVLNEDAIPSGILEYEGGNEERHPKPKAFEIALGFAVAMCLKLDTTRIERFIHDLRAEHRRSKAYEARYSPVYEVRLR